MLRKNHGRMGLLPRGSTDVWYTETTPLYNINVFTKNGVWYWEISCKVVYKKMPGGDSLEDAYSAAVDYVNKLLANSKPKGIAE